MQVKEAPMKMDILTELLNEARNKGMDESITFKDMMEWLTNQLKVSN
ncbi:hypothetical protein [Jeotgalibacillus campisalis]|uniref:Uncharacterized protein n=1 Tax=Jeotgalibacillus campisalis TaxID=220754 RepID=A0A0C2V290_9BACL|nr:hypothetical protein [Jeotgalibacillus campisalis]KIL43167.1 hypothetical protein KR50_35700 [Jeotgalibacillus campisalis]